MVMNDEWKDWLEQAEKDGVDVSEVKEQAMRKHKIMMASAAIKQTGRKVNAKRYLQRIEKYGCCIEQKKQQLKELSEKMLSVSAINAGEKVSGGGMFDFSENVLRKIELENEINADIVRFERLKNDIVDQIQSMDNAVYINLLYKRYVECKRLEVIAVEMNYSYAYIRELHGWALKEFNNKFIKLPTQ